MVGTLREGGQSGLGGQGSGYKHLPKKLRNYTTVGLTSALLGKVLHVPVL